MIQYNIMKKHKGSGKSIIITASKASKNIWLMLAYNEPFNTNLIGDENLNKIAESMCNSEKN